MLDTDILIKNGGFSKEFEKNQIIFSQGDSPKYFYQIITGRVKMNNYNQEGREFIQGVFSCGESFGEPPLFIDHNYPANAIAIDPTTILMIDKLDLFEILKSNPSLCFDVFKTLSNKLLYKSTMAPVISCNDSQRRIMTLLEFIKENEMTNDKSPIDLTRQQIADLTGLRVETVIRTIKDMEAQKQVQIKKGKVFL